MVGTKGGGAYWKGVGDGGGGGFIRNLKLRTGSISRGGLVAWDDD